MSKAEPCGVQLTWAELDVDLERGSWDGDQAPTPLAQEAMALWGSEEQSTGLVGMEGIPDVWVLLLTAVQGPPSATDGVLAWL